MTRQRGNILFLILLAVVLFAALTYAVTGSQKGGTKDASSEKVKTLSAEILQKATLMENTIQRMMMVNGCKDNEISFENPTVANYVNPNANVVGTNKKCHVFDPAGGGLSYPTMPREAYDPAMETYGNAWGQAVFTGQVFVTQVGTDCTTAVCSELVFMSQGLTKAVCDHINEQMGNGGTLVNGSFAGFEPDAADYFKGTYYYYANGGIYSAQTSMFGKRTGCVKRQDFASYGNPYMFYHVLLAR